ncbi:MAG: hypothetical protein QGH37_32555 [Candidatus Poribacteria bacterium]|nr:hypothetical protein [Candidatus Poribacteria bacterium]
MKSHKTPWMLVIIFAIAAVVLDAYDHPVFAWITGFLAICCIQAKDVWLGLAVFGMTALFWLEYESGWILVCAVVGGIIVGLPARTWSRSGPNTKVAVNPQQVPQQVSQQGLGILGKIGVYTAVTALLSFGSYKLAKHLTSRKGRKRPWRG